MQQSPSVAELERLKSPPVPVFDTSVEDRRHRASIEDVGGLQCWATGFMVVTLCLANASDTTCGHTEGYDVEIMVEAAR